MCECERPAPRKPRQEWKQHPDGSWTWGEWRLKPGDGRRLPGERRAYPWHLVGPDHDGPIGPLDVNDALIRAECSISIGPLIGRP